MIFLSLFAIFVSSVVIILWKVQQRYSHFTVQNIIGPKPKFLFGNLKSSILKKRHVAYDIHDIYQEFKGKAPVVGFFAMFDPYILLMDPKLIKVCRKFRNNDFTVSALC